MSRHPAATAPSTQHPAPSTARSTQHRTQHSALGTQHRTQHPALGTQHPEGPANAAAHFPSNLLNVDGAEAFILAQARKGNREAFRTLVERHSRAVFRVAFRVTGNEQDAEDVVQETFLKAYTELSRFEARAGFGTWVHRIAANSAVDLLRKRTRHANVTPLDNGASVPLADRLAAEAPDPERETAGRELGERIEAALATLSPLERAAFTLRHLEQRPVSEVAMLLGQSAVAARHSVFRAVGKMRRALAPLAGIDR
jgi:RNA polymerase sigma-70 factor, ECF subfamily